jgi:long-chain acyl-CoA synthetase
MAWQIANFGCQYAGAITVPIPDVSPFESARYIISHSDSKVMVVHSQQLELAKQLLRELPELVVIVISKLAPAPLITLDEFLHRGQLFDSFQKFTPSKNDICAILYTFTSLSEPKGCVLTHGNIVAGATGLGNVGFSISSKDTYFSYLPLSHIYEFCCQLTMLAHGVRIGFFGGDPRDLITDIGLLQPTVMCGVPGIFNRMVATIREEIDRMSPLLKWIVNWAVKTKLESIASGEDYSLFLDLLLFSQFRQHLGGRIRIIVSGGAPLKPEVYELVRAVITPNIIQGYGATEMAAAGCVQEVGSTNPLPVGPVCIAADVKFRRVDGLNYDPNGSPPSGELLFKGPSIFQGYYKDEAATSDVFEDGWYVSGDVGCLTSDGHIQLIDRVKQFMKLSHGEYISLNVLGSVYANTPGVRSIFVFANSHHAQPVAVVVPTEVAIDDWRARGIIDLSGSESAKNEMLQSLLETAGEHNLRPFERVLDIIIETVPFTEPDQAQGSHFSALRSKYEARLLELYLR